MNECAFWNPDGRLDTKIDQLDLCDIVTNFQQTLSKSCYFVYSFRNKKKMILYINVWVKHNTWSLKSKNIFLNLLPYYLLLTIKSENNHKLKFSCIEDLLLYILEWLWASTRTMHIEKSTINMLFLINAVFSSLWMLTSFCLEK